MKRLSVAIVIIFCATILNAQRSEIPEQENFTKAVSSITSDVVGDYGSANVWESLYGTIPGLVVVEQLGWDAAPQLYIRGAGTNSARQPLLLVDGFVRDISEVSPSEVEKISVLKDGAATAIYGQRGANGVVEITTKRGKYNTMQVNATYKYGMGLVYDVPKFVDGADYATAYNEALANDGLPLRYTEREIEAFRTGEYNGLYPDVDWMKEGLRDFTTNHQAGVSFSGGGSRVRYFTHIDYLNRMGLLKNTSLNDKYSTQMRDNKLSARVNLDVRLTNTTDLSVNLYGQLKEFHRPSGDGTNIAKFYRLPSNAMPIKTGDGNWGANDNFTYNPIADVVDVGYFNSYTRRLQSDITLRQSFSNWVKGLSAQVSVAYDNLAIFQEGNRKTYSYQIIVPTLDSQTGEILSASINNHGEDKPLEYSSALANQRIDSAFEARVCYDRVFGDHGLNTYVMYRQESTIPSGRNSTRKYQNIAWAASYSYSGKYFVDVVANCHGASVLLKGHRFEFFPAISAAWDVSKEKFMKSANVVDWLRLKISAGRSGLSDFGYELDRQYMVNGGSYYFTASNTMANGMKEGNLPMSSLVSQVSDKVNVGVDMGFFNGLSVSLDGFYERRSRILLATDALYSSVLGITPEQKCNGVIDAKGLDSSVEYSGTAGEFKYNIGAVFSFARTRIVRNNEGNLAEPYLSRKGTRVGQYFGLQAIGFFNSQEEINESPRQTFSSVKPGDIKYKDVNGDNVIDANDMVPMGYSTVLPEIYYGWTLGAEYKGLGLRLHFQGTGNYNCILSTAGIYRPMSSNANLSEWYWTEHVRWTAETAEYADLPRLTTQVNQNNNQNSSFWLADASYLTLRNAYLYYNLPLRWFSKTRISMFRIFVKGDNLFRIDKIKYSNPDNVGVYYPDMRMVYAGVNVKF